MKLKANDTLHVSSVGPENIAPGEVFEVSDDVGKQLVERGLATEAKGAKAEKAAPENKKEDAPENKAVSSLGKAK
jgi:hypothetical protein